MKHNLIFVFFLLITLFLTSCSSYKIIERNELQYVNKLPLDNIKIVLKNGQKIDAKEIDVSKDSISIIKKERIYLTNTRIHRKRKDIYTKLKSINLSEVEKITYKNHLAGFVQGLFGGFALGVGAGILTAQSIEHTEGGAFFSLITPLIIYGTVNATAVIYGVAKGYTKEYTFFDLNDKLKYAKIRNKKTSLFKLGVSAFNNDNYDPRFSIGYNYTFSKKNIIYNFGCLNIRFDGVTEYIPIPIFNEIEFFRFGYRHYFTKNSKTSFYIGNNISLGSIFFDNFYKNDTAHNSYSGKNFALRFGTSFGLNLIANNKMYDIDFSINLPLKAGNSYKVVDEVEVRSERYWFPTFQLSIGL